MKLKLLATAAVAASMVIGGSAFAASVTLRLGHTLPPTHVHSLALEAFAKDVADMSKGDIKIEVYPAEQLGGARDQIEAIIHGTQDMGYDGAGVMSQFFPKISVLDMPFMFSNYDELEKVFYSPVGQELAAELLKQRGLRLLAISYYGARQVSSNKPIRKVEDFEGLKIRTPQVKEWVSSFRALGAAPTPIAFGEVYFSLQTNVVDAENPLSTIDAYKFYEVQKYVTLTNHQIGANYIIINEKKWESLTPDQQKIIMEAAKKEMTAVTAKVKDQDNSLISKLEAKGLEFIRPDAAFKANMKAAVQKIYPQYEDKWGKGTVEKIRDVLK